MITTINEFRKINEENLLIPRRLEDRHIQKRKNNLRLLQKEVIDGDLTIDKSFLDFKSDQIKVKKINGNVTLKDFNHIPEWLKDVEINGYFNCSNLGLTSLDNCPNATKLYCSNNKLTSLKLNDKLTYLSCHHNKLTSIICNDKLIHLYCWDNNNLTSLTLNDKLTYLSCQNNQLTSLTLNDKLTYLDCRNNQLTSLTLNENLTTLFCSNNQLPMNNFKDMSIKQIRQYYGNIDK